MPGFKTIGMLTQAINVMNKAYLILNKLFDGSNTTLKKNSKYIKESAL
jgi:hypothetical protein